MPVVRAGAAKWKARASGAQSDYQAGVRNPRRSWEEATLQAVEAYTAGIQAALSQGSFAKGVSRVGNKRWQDAAANIGTIRYVQGIQASADRYEQGFAPYRAVIESLNLPPRGPRGDRRNYERVTLIGEALHQAKLERRK